MPADIGTSDEQRVAAASVVHLDPSPDVLLLSDRDFVFALWEKAREAGERLETVRIAAEEAMASTSADDYARFVATGIHEAYEVDKQREQDRADAERAARQAKAQALIAVGIPVTPDLLALSDDNFIRRVMKHQDAGAEVKAAAARALAGSPADWRKFIANGAREAHDRDVANELKELEEKNREEAQRRKELAARTNVAALFAITPSEAMLNLGDDNFIRELIRSVPADARDTDLYAAAQAALNSSAPADWKEFLHAGAEQAYKRDDEARRKKVADANRRRALEIQAGAEKTGMYPGLVAAAQKALAGSDEDVARFLREDSQERAKRQSFQPSSGKQAGWYIRQSSVDGGAAFLAPVDAEGQQADREDATWVIVPSLAMQPGCYSFESVRKPGYYLMQKDLRVRISANDRSAAFAKDATWCARKGLAGSGTSFESASQPGRWLRQFQGDLYAGDKSGKHRYDTGKDFAQDATWKISSPLAG
ncbi:AbfB domain-containing protein [Streptomyces varsoviensis]|nr:AbfB domain-containing protein [Streptomyces varsoviensis]